MEQFVFLSIIVLLLWKSIMYPNFLVILYKIMHKTFLSLFLI